MLRKVFLLFFFLCNLSCAIIAQQNINFTSLSIQDGLSSNIVNAILKDRTGLMWFATEDGLNRYDGTNFTVYRYIPGDSTSLQANEIICLYEDKSGNLWVGTGGGSLSLYNREHNTFTNFAANKGANSLSSNVIWNISSDFMGYIWVAHHNGIQIIDPKTKKITTFTPNAQHPFRKVSTYLFEDSRHNMWIGTTEGLFVYNRPANSINQFIHTTDPASLTNNTVNAILEDAYGNIWIGTDGGLSMLQPGGKAFINYYHDPATEATIINNEVNTLAISGKNELWVGTGNGLSLLDLRTRKFNTFKSDSRNTHSLTTNTILSLYIDKQGIYWIGTYRGGINKYDQNLNLFNLVQSNPLDKQGLQGRIITSFAEDINGKIFIGTEEGGVSLFDPATKRLHHFDLPSSRKGTDNQLVILAIERTSNGKLLIGTYNDGLYELNPVTGNYLPVNGGTSPEDPDTKSLFCIMEDRRGNRWIGTNGSGLYILDKNNQLITRFTPTPKEATDIRLPINGYIRDIVEDKQGNVWIATHGGGIAMYNPPTGKFRIYTTSNSSLPNDKVRSVLEDRRGNIWVGTFGGGVCSLNTQSGQFTVFSEKEGLQNNNIYKLVEDKNGTIWLSADKGLSSLDANTKKINNYNYHNGLQHNSFVLGAGLCSSNGDLYFGGVNGFNYFNPGYLKKNRNVPAVLITDLKISNQSVKPSEDGPIQENISIAKEIHLDYKQNFALSFVGLNYTAPAQNQYAYKLESFDKDWNYAGNATTASYTNLDPGEYNFKVIASNNDDVWNREGTSIKVFVHPPFWRTTFAYLLYLLAIGCILFYIRHRGITKLKSRFAAAQMKILVEQQQKEAERIHELDQLKIKFLTNLSHEFRTPISLIAGPAETLLAQGSSERQNGQLQLIKRNSKRLLNMVNQLLDFRKMEEHELKLQVSDGEFVSFVKEVTDSFKDLSEKKKIGFECHSSFDELYTRFDHDKVERILFNLLSNAFKFTLNGGTVSLVINKAAMLPGQPTTWVSIEIKDNGIGIPANQQEKIFERFFQHTTAGTILNQGTGIGLSITKEFVEMQGGVIEVQSEPGLGTSFIVRLPLVQLTSPVAIVEEIPITITDEAGQLPESIEEIETVAEASVKDSNDDLPSILLVEDNEDFRFYLKDNLQLQYKVYEASNGKEGWQKALARHPQLIVSDVSMPCMDGIELCKKIKSDKRTSHIPVILLTALTAEQDQLRGLEIGANDYITKPFNFEVLNAKVKNLMVLNKVLKTTYTKQIKILAPEMKIESADEKLMESIMRYIEENLTDSQLSVKELSRYVGMSRSSLYTKLLELTGQTPVEFIRSVKLDKAAILLEKSDLTIAQIAYSVGFTTPNYFTKLFKVKYNILPSEYIQKKKQ